MRRMVLMVSPTGQVMTSEIRPGAAVDPEEFRLDSVLGLTVTGGGLGETGLALFLEGVGVAQLPPEVPVGERDRRFRLVPESEWAVMELSPEDRPDFFGADLLEDA